MGAIRDWPNYVRALNIASRKWPKWPVATCSFCLQAKSAVAGFVDGHFGIGVAMSGVAKKVELGLQQC